MKICLTTILLSIAITLISIGIHTNNLIFVGVGGGLAGVYNSMIQTKLKEK